MKNRQAAPGTCLLAVLCAILAMGAGGSVAARKPVPFDELGPDPDD